MRKIDKKLVLITSICIFTTLLFAQPSYQKRPAPKKAIPLQGVLNEAKKNEISPREDINRFFDSYERLIRKAESAFRNKDIRDLNRCKEEKKQLENTQRKLNRLREWTRKDDFRYHEMSDDLEDILRKPIPAKKVTPIKPEPPRKKNQAEPIRAKPVR